MAIFDFLFGRTKPTPTTSTQVTTSKLPEEIAPFVTQVLEEAKEQYDIAKERGYQPYPGETIAPRTQEEKDAIAGLRGLIGTQQPYQEEAEAALRGIDTEFTAEQAEKFMSPYQQAVIDVEKRKAQEDFERRIMPEFEKQAVGAGGMSGLGSRAGVQAARLGEAFGQQLGDIQAKGQQKAYQDAYRQFVDQGQRQREQAADLRGIGLQKFQTGLAEQGLGQQLAQEDRAETQAIFDKAFREYTEQEQYPESELAQLSSFVYGNPYLRQPDTTRTTTGMLQPTSSIGQGLLGLGLTGLNIYGRGLGASGGPWTAANFGRSVMGRKAGGGLRSLPVVKRQVNGPVTRSNYQYPQTNTVPQKEPTNNPDLTPRLKEILASLAAKQGTSGYGTPTDDLLSGALAKRQADRRKKVREEIIKGMKEAMPKPQRLSALLVAAKRVMGADPSKGFINAVVEGMAGLDEAQQEDYLRQKEQELKILELEGKGKLDDLTATEAAETEAAKFPIKIAEIEAKKIGNKFKLSKAQLEVAKIILSNLDQIISDPTSFEEIAKLAFASVPGAENFGKEVLAEIRKKVFKIAGKQGNPQSIAAVRDKRGRVMSKGATVNQIPNIKKQQ